MADHYLPAELWNRIFDLAADEDVIYQYGLPDFTAEHAWLKLFNANEWSLRTPQLALDQLQRQSYVTKKAIISTCKFWYHIGTEFLYRCLFFDSPSKLVTLAQRFAHLNAQTSSSPAPGWWTRRIHIRQYYTSMSLTQDTIDYALASIIKSFMRIADSLATYNHKHLRTIHWKVPCETLPKVIWALDSLPFLLSAHITIKPPLTEDAIEHLGSAFDVHLTLHYLQQLFIDGHVVEFLEQAAGWSLPSLRALSIDCGLNSHDQPDVIAFLVVHGSNLVSLNLNSIPPLDVPKILDLCPLLAAFSFNADWRMEQQGSVTLGTDKCILVNRPHENIRFLGLHGLAYAFGVGLVGENAMIGPLPARFIARTNDMNVEELNRANFPGLQVVRCLNRTLLEDLNKADGPSRESGGLERWERWYGTFSQDLHPDRPADEDVDSDEYEGEYDDEDQNEDEEEYEGEWVYDPDGKYDDGEYYEDGDGEYEEGEYADGEWEIDIPPPPVTEEDLPRTKILRDLLDECRAMNATREEPMFSSLEQSMSMFAI